MAYTYHTHTTERNPPSRTISFLIAGALFITGMASLIIGVNLAERHHRWRQASPINFAVDLSQAGMFSGAFQHTCPIAQGTVLGLEISDGIANHVSYTEMLNTLQCTCRITDAVGNQVAQSRRIPAHHWEEGWFYWAFPMARLPALPEGHYTLYFNVTQGVRELAGVPVRLIARYELGGAELLPETLAMLLGGTLVFVATLIPIIIGVRMIVERNKDKSQSLPDTSRKSPLENISGRKKGESA